MLKTYKGKIERKETMKKRNMKMLSLALSLAMVAGVTGPKTEFAEKTKNIIQRTKLKEYTVSAKELNKIAQVAKNDGAKAADMVNKLGGNDFEAAVNRVLTEYYEKGETEYLDDFEKEVDKEAADILAGFKEAAIEREQRESLPYEASASLLTFGSDITEEEIKNIVKDQYGECEYIHKCPDDTYMVKVKNSLGLTVDKAVEAYGKYVETIAVDKNQKVEQIAEAYEYCNDTYVSGQYYLRTMNVVDAWLYIRGKNHSKVKVAVVDGGADLNSADMQASSGLSAEILSNGSSIPLRNSSSMYNNSHGTTVAGVLAGTSNNSAQIAGVASCIDNSVAELINIKIEMYVDKIAVGVDYALSVGAKVVNLSLAHEGANSVEEAAINRFIAAGGTVVAGAGNSGNDVATYPSDYGNVISVISVDEGRNISGTSCRGWNKDICAPGVGIYAPNITGQAYDTIVTGGTSLASPMVSAVVTMMYSVNSGMNATSAWNIIRDTAMDLGEAGRDYTYAYGHVNAYAAVVAAGGGSTEQPTTTKAPSSNGPQEVFGQLITSNTQGIIDVVWGAATNGQTYNVYLDGNIATDVNGTTLRNVGCAAYQIPASAGSHTIKITAVLNGQESAGVTGTVTVTGGAETITTTVSSDGYNTAGANWTELNYWSVYFASGWAGDPKGSYKDGGSYNSFSVRINTPSNGEWGVQTKTKEISVTAGEKYICKVNVNANMATTSNVRIKEDKTAAEKLQTLKAGANTFELEFTAVDTAQIVFDLGLAPAGLEFIITSFSLEKEAEETTTEEPTTRTFDAYSLIEAEHFASNEGGVIDTNSNASGGYNIGGVSNGTTMRYDNVNFSENAGAITICYSSPTGTANGNAEIYVDSLNNKVATVTLANNGATWQDYGMLTANLDTEISKGKHTIYVKYVTTGNAYYVANVDYYKFVKASDIEKPTEEPTTEEPTTTVDTIEGGIEINGFQVSATSKGMRTIYSVDSEIDGKAVRSSGVVYSLADYAEEADMYVGSTSKYVKSYASTTSGVSSIVYADSDLATSYAMTMLFATTEAAEFSAKWRVRAYAELSDGTYVYTDIYTYTIYEVADHLHQNCKMNTEAHHDYLYTGILSIVNPTYIKKDYNWNNSIVGA